MSDLYNRHNTTTRKRTWWFDSGQNDSENILFPSDVEDKTQNVYRKADELQRGLDDNVKERSSQIGAENKEENNGRVLSFLYMILYYVSLLIPDRVKRFLRSLPNKFSKWIIMFLPQWLKKKDVEDGSGLSVAQSVLSRWMKFYMWKFGYSLLFGVAIAFVVYFLVIKALNEPVRITFRDHKNGRVENVQLYLNFVKDPHHWIKNEDVAHLLKSNLKEDEIERGFFETWIKDIGMRNLSLDYLKLNMKRECPTTDSTCDCICGPFFGVPKNIIFVTSMFMINPQVASRSTETVSVYYKGEEESDHNQYHKKDNWIVRPKHITVEYINEGNKKYRVTLDPKPTSCFLSCQEMIVMK